MCSREERGSGDQNKKTTGLSPEPLAFSAMRD